MIDRLVHGLAADTDLDAEQILDVLWLSAAYRAGSAEPADPGDSEPPDPEETEFRARAPVTAPDVLPIYLDSRPEYAGDAAPATAIGFDAPRPLQKVATLPMPMRRLRKVVAPGPRQVVDIDATVDATAEAKRLMLKLTRPPQRALDLALVVDDSLSMRIWDDVFDDLERLLAQAGAFRSVSRWRLAVPEGAIRPHVRHRDGDEAPAAPLHRPEQLVDPSGRRLVLVATDARALSWYDKAPWDAIATWCAAMPTVLVHVLPQQYWANTAVGAPYMTSRALTPAAPNAQYQRRFAWWTAEPEDPPLPVVALTEKSLDAWAQSIVSGTVWASGITATAPDPDSDRPVDGATPADVAVHDFLTKATTGAQRLARILASTDVPLSMPLISVLRERLAPQTGVAELAEIMASDLLETAGFTSDGQPLLRYRAGAREILCRGTSAFEDWDALAAVGRYLEDRDQVGGPLRVLVPDPAGLAERDPDDKPFYDFQHALAVRLGLRSGQPALAAVTADFDPAELREQPGAWQEGLEALGWAEKADGDQALRDTLAAEIARLGDGDEIKVAAFGTDGIAVWRITRDENGTPQGRPSVLTTAPVTDPQDFYTRRLVPSLGDSRLLIAVGAADESQAAVLGLLRNAGNAPAFSHYEPFDDLLYETIRNTPLTRWYDLILLSETADGQLRVDSQPLFRPGAASGDRTEPFPVECGPADPSGTVFAVVARSPGQEPFLRDRFHRVQVQSTLIPPGTYQVTALLDGPGKVQFHGLPAVLSADQRPLAGLISQVPERLQTPPPVHLVCLIEVSSDRARLRRRIDRLEQLILAADTGRRPLAVSVISYGSHAIASYISEEPATLRTWATLPDQAVRALRGLLGRGVPQPRQDYPMAAQTECALNQLSAKIYERAGRPVVVTVGGRPPHPPGLDIQSEIIPCPKKVDWHEPLDRLRKIRGIRFGALCDPGALGEIWTELGRDAFGYVDHVDVERFATRLGLREPSQPVPFPLVVPVPGPVSAAGGNAGLKAAEGNARRSGVARIAVLGPVGSGTTTFLAALNMTLMRQPYGSEQEGGDVPWVHALSQMTDLLVTRREFPPATQGTDWFEWTLIQQGKRPGDPGAHPPATIPLRVMHPAGKLLHPSLGGPERQMLLRDLASAQGIIYMFDPIREIAVGDASETAGNLLRQLRRQVAGTGADSSDRKLPHHVAVCLTKFDEEPILQRAFEQELVKTDRHDRYRFPRVPDSRARDFIAGLSAISNGSDVELLLSTFGEFFHRDRVRYFVTSAVGFYVNPETGRFDRADPANIIRSATGSGPTIRGPIHPINVVEPVLWLASRIAGA